MTTETATGDRPAVTPARAELEDAHTYRRASILSRVSAVLRLHPPGGDADDSRPTCDTAVPCATAQALAW
jgi:hypothetical protein